MKRDFYEMLSEFYKGRLNREISVTFLVLNLKVPNAVDLKEYRPISLVGVVYRLSKILTNRMKKVLPSIIDAYQGSFVHKRQIFYGVLIANELIHARKQSREAGFILKIDMEKAYKHVAWALWIIC